MTCFRSSFRKAQTLVTLTVALATVLIPIVNGAEGRIIASYARRRALVIGNASYSSSPLKNPLHDAQDMAAKLVAFGFSVDLVLDADQAHLATAVLGFSQNLRPSDVALLYYSGHGFQMHGENYMDPTSFSANDGVAAAI